jgi:Uma2 family endonuclease
MDMAAEPAAPFVSVEQYLNTDYPNGDCEYVDGVLEERYVGTLPHSRLQKILLARFLKYEDAMGFEALPECRTRVRETRFRVPDIILVSTPYDGGARYYGGVPLAVIEILSPEDRMLRVMKRFDEFAALGVRSIIQMDPEQKVTRVFENGDLYKRELESLDFGGKQIPFDTRALYSQL